MTVAQIFMAKSFQFAMQRKMQLILSNITNAETVGYKRKSMQMESVFPMDLQKTIEKYQEPGNLWEKQVEMAETVLPVRSIEVTRNFNTGVYQMTESPTDIAVENGTGLFQFRAPDGRIVYSRAGNLHMDGEGYLIDPQGHPLEPAIRIPENTQTISITQEGKVLVTVDTDRKAREIGQITLAKFRKPDELMEIGHNQYAETEMSGEPVIIEPGLENVGFIKQNMLEISNVNLMEEAVDMLLTQRCFEVCCKAQDGVEGILKHGADLKGT